MTGVVPVVPQGSALPRGGDGQQHAAAIHVVDEEIAAAIEEALGPEGLDDEALHLGRRAVAMFPVVDGLGRLQGHRHPLAQGRLEGGLGEGVGEIQIADGRRHLGTEALLLLGGKALLQAVEQPPVLGEADEQEADTQGKRHGDHDDQRAGKMQAGQISVGDADSHEGSGLGDRLLSEASGCRPSDGAASFNGRRGWG